MVNRISKVLFILMLVELCLGGGGRFTAIGPVSLRMILFSVALVISVPLFIERKLLPSEIWKLMIGFVFVLAIGIVIGLANENPKRLIFEDVKPLCYFFVLPFFYLTVDETMISTIIKIIKTTSVWMTALFIVVLVLVGSDTIHFLDFYRATLKSEELFFRGEITFFYKGFLFLGIAAIFYHFTDHSKWSKLFIAAFIIAIVLSITRGLLFSLALTFSTYFIINKSYIKANAGLIIVFMILIWGSDFILSASRHLDTQQNNKSYVEADPTLLGDRNYSDNGRLTQVKEVWQEVSLSSTLVGHGFGTGTPSRPIHMEIAYLEIFHKQGLIGLFFWASFAVLISIKYLKARPSTTADAFFYSSLFIFIESLTNQYINNPIGMSILLLSWVCLFKLKKEE